MHRSLRGALRLAALLVPTLAVAQSPARRSAPAPGAAAAAAASGRAAVVARIDSLGRTFVAEGNAPSASIAVVRGGRDTLLLRAYGLANVERKTPATAATVYRIGSVTKQFTSSLVMRLVERGAVRLDDPISRHLSGLPAAWQPIPVRQLLNHTSGIPSYTNAGLRWFPRLAEPMPPDTLLAITAGDTLDFTPGTKWSYNNTGYVLLGMLLERKLGRPYAELVRTELASPLGLTATRYCEDGDTTAATIAHGYVKPATEFQRPPYMHMSQPYAAGALCSTAGDIARWNRLLATGRVVGPASFRAMTSPDSAALTGPLKYGFGLAVDTLGGHAMVTHGGGIFGFISANAYFPDDSLSVTVLANGAPSDPNGLMRNVARAALGLPPDRPLVAVTLTAADRARYVGSYEVQLPGRVLPMRIFEQGDKLMSQAQGQGAFELLPRGDHVFGVTFDPAVRLTFTVEGDRATKLTLLQGGRTFEAPRVP